MRLAVIPVVLAALMLTLAAGCQKSRSGVSSLNITTTLPENIPIQLVRVDQPNAYIQRARTDIGGTIHFVGIDPGRYKLVFQFSAPDVVPTHPTYNYGESDPFTVKPGANSLDWTAGSTHVAPTS